MKRLTFAECPKTRSAFIQKWNSDRVFKARAQYTGFEVLFGTAVRLPNGEIAGATVKQPYLIKIMGEMSATSV